MVSDKLEADDFDCRSVDSGMLPELTLSGSFVEPSPLRRSLSVKSPGSVRRLTSQTSGEERTEHIPLVQKQGQFEIDRDRLCCLLLAGYTQVLLCVHYELDIHSFCCVMLDILFTHIF